MKDLKHFVFIYFIIVVIISLQAQEIESAGIKIIKEYYATYAKLQPDLLRKFFADDIEWHIPGHHPLSGTKKGPEEVLAFFKQLSKAKFKAELIYLSGNEEYVVDIHRGWSNTGKDDIDMPWVLLFRIKNGKIQEARNWAWDQHAADAFFWKVYHLKPIPERLSNSLSENPK